MIHKSFIFNNFARTELAKFIMDGVSPLPHPDDFVKAVDDQYKEDFNGLCDMIYYCGYLGFCYDRNKIPDFSFDRIPKVDNKNEIWIAFLESEGVFLNFTEQIPDGKSKGKVRWEDILSYAFGEIGLKPWDFYRMTMSEYAIMTNGYFWKRWRPDEYVRLITYKLSSIFRGKKDALPKSIEAFYPLPSDKKGILFLEQDEIKRMWAIAKKM
jgi:hypothetical protein